MMSKRALSVTLDEETIKMLTRIGKEVLHDTNMSLAIRYAVKYAASEILKEK